MTTKHKRPGRWKPGESGNPSGRKPGSGEVAKLRALIGNAVPEIVNRLVTQAKEGDAGAARLLLERVLPALKPVDESVVMTMPDGSLTEQGRAVVTAMAQGALTPTQGAVLLGAIGTLGKLTETDELLRRIEALENTNGNKPR